MDDLNSDLFEDPILDDDKTLQDFDPDADEENKPGGNRTFMIAVGALVAVFLVGLITLVVLVTMTQPGRNQAREEEVAQINAANTSAAATATSFAVAGGVQGTLDAVAAQATSVAALSAVTARPGASGPASVNTEPPPGAANPTMVLAENTATLPPTATETLSPAEALSGNPDARTATVQFLLTLSAGGAQAVTESASGDPAASTPVIQSEAMTATAYAYQATASGVTTTLPNTGFWDEVGIPLMLGGAALLVMIIILVRRLRLSN